MARDTASTLGDVIGGNAYMGDLLDLDEPTLDRPWSRAAVRVDGRTLFGHVMGLVALTTGFAAFGAYIGRNLTSGTALLCFLGAIACTLALSAAAAVTHNGFAIGCLFALGLVLGISAGPLVAHYAHTEPAVVWQAAGCTAAFCGALGALGYAIRRDLSVWGRVLFFGLLGLIAFGLVAIFVAIPHANLIYCLAGLAAFGGYTVIDFNRLRHTHRLDAAPLLAAAIFLDLFNVFLFLLQLLGDSES